MQTLNLPYELLIRWDQDGKLCGAHQQRRYVIRDDDGKVAGESITPAEALGLTDFPLQDILSQAQTLALVENAALRTRVDQLEPLIGELAHVQKEYATLTDTHTVALDERRRIDEVLKETRERLHSTEQLAVGLSDENARLRQMVRDLTKPAAPDETNPTEVNA